MTEKTLNKEEFKSLLDVLNLMKDVCNDVDIRNGQIRQLVNNKTFLIETNVGNFIGGNDLSLPLIKNKISLLSIFLDGSTDNDIKFMEFDGKYIFSDDVTMLRFTVSKSSTHLDNKFISEEEKSQMFVLPAPILFSCNLDKFTLSKIKIITDNLNVEDVLVNIVEQKASFDIVSFNKLNDAKILKDIPVQNIDNGHYRCTLSATPFKLDFQEGIDFTMYDISNDNDGKILCQLKTNFNGCELNIYTPGYLVPIQE